MLKGLWLALAQRLCIAREHCLVKWVGLEHLGSIRKTNFALQRQMANTFCRGPFPEQSKAGMKAISVPEPGGLLWLLVGEA